MKPDTESPKKEGRRGGEPLKVLLCDDHGITRCGVKQVLEKEFPRVQFGEADDAAQALALFTRESWSLVLLDINLPGPSGLELLDEMKTLKPRVPILMLSGLSEREFGWRALRSGAAGYLAKTCIVTELKDAVGKVLAGGKYISSVTAEELATRLAREESEAPHQDLSVREFQVLRLIAAGKAMKEIAAELALNAKTASTYRARLCSKLRITSDAEITRYALQHGLID